MVGRYLLRMYGGRLREGKPPPPPPPPELHAAQLLLEAVRRPVSDSIGTPQLLLEAVRRPVSDSIGTPQLLAEALIKIPPPPVPEDYLALDFQGKYRNAWNPQDSLAAGAGIDYADYTGVYLINSLYLGEVFKVNDNPPEFGGARTMSPAVGRRYWEILVDAMSGDTMAAGLSLEGWPHSLRMGEDDESVGWRPNGEVWYDGSPIASAPTYAQGDHLMFAFEAQSGKLWLGINGSFSGDPAAGTGETLTLTPDYWYPTAQIRENAPAQRWRARWVRSPWMGAVPEDRWPTSAIFFGYFIWDMPAGFGDFSSPPLPPPMGG